MSQVPGESFLPADSSLLVYECKFWNEGVSFLAGTDEAGRGCCAGPVVAAAVMFTDPAHVPAGVFDSKQLTEAQRGEMRLRIIHTPGVRYAVAEADPETIDRINILQASWKAMHDALAQLLPDLQFALVDGNPVKGLPVPSQNIIKGDAKSASIAAASILAKTHRDALMAKAAEEFPQYGFEIHKGYCTALHTERIQQYGPCPLHRKTFEPVKSYLNPMIQGELF